MQHFFSPSSSVLCTVYGQQIAVLDKDKCCAPREALGIAFFFFQPRIVVAYKH